MAGQTKKSEKSLTKFSCQYCSKSFSKETTLATHNCETKRRIAQRNETGVRLALNCFIKFYNLVHPTSASKTYEDFVGSPYYLAFVRFGRYLEEINAIDPEKYCDWLLRNNHKLDNWCKDSLYEQYLLEYLLSEVAGPALERSIETMNKWADENSARYQDYFKYATHNRICFDVQRGRISAWAIYCSETGKDFLNKIDTASLESIWAYIDSERWSKNFEIKLLDFNWAQKIMQQAGI
jgi:hypothetical protein